MSAAQAAVPHRPATTWFGVMAPARTPPELVATLNQAFAAALDAPASRARLRAEGFQLGASTPEQFAAYIAAETRKWAPVAAASGAVVN